MSAFRMFRDAGVTQWPGLTQSGTARIAAAWLVCLAVLPSACEGRASNDAGPTGASGSASSSPENDDQPQGGSAHTDDSTAGAGGTATEGGTTAQGGAAGHENGHTGQTFRSYVTYADGQYLVFGTRENATTEYRGFILSSTDARSWKLVHVGENESLTQATRAKDAWYAAGSLYDVKSETGTALLLRSEDGQDWQRATTPDLSSLSEVFWTGELLLSSGRDRETFKTQLFFSERDDSWQKYAGPSIGGFAQTSGVIVGHDGLSLYRSIDAGRNFTKVPLPSDAPNLSYIDGIWSTESGFEGTAL